jgi:hypothetical protein
VNDTSLRDAFAGLRAEESAHAPHFDHMVRPRAARRPPALWAFAAMLLIVVTLMLWPHRSKQPSITAWRAPTDFLLATPGRELLQSTPDLKGDRQ